MQVPSLLSTLHKYSIYAVFRDFKNIAPLSFITLSPLSKSVPSHFTDLKHILFLNYLLHQDRYLISISIYAVFFFFPLSKSSFFALSFAIRIKKSFYASTVNTSMLFSFPPAQKQNRDTEIITTFYIMRLKEFHDLPVSWGKQSYHFKLHESQVC